MLYGVNVCIGISSGGTIQINTTQLLYMHQHTYNVIQTASTVLRYTHPHTSPNPYPIPKSTRKNGTRILFTHPTFDFGYRSFPWTALLDQWQSDYHYSLAVHSSHNFSHVYISLWCTVLTLGQTVPFKRGKQPLIH